MVCTSARVANLAARLTTLSGRPASLATCVASSGAGTLLQVLRDLGQPSCEAWEWLIAPSPQVQTLHDCHRWLPGVKITMSKSSGRLIMQYAWNTAGRRTFMP